MNSQIATNSPHPEHALSQVTPWCDKAVKSYQNQGEAPDENIAQTLPEIAHCAHHSRESAQWWLMVKHPFKCEDAKVP